LLPIYVHHCLSLAALGLPGTVHVLNFGEELGGEDVDFLVGAVQQAQCSDLVGGGRVVSGCLGFLAAISGLEGCDFGGLLGRSCEFNVFCCAL
jgi:hypothetical protein